MPKVTEPPPHSSVEVVTDVLHGVSVEDPYRWLEDQESARTRAWIEEQAGYARGYLDRIPGRDLIGKRIHQFLSVKAYDCLQRAGDRYFFRKRLPGQEQPCIYMREGPDGEDQLLVDPRQRGTDIYTAVRPLKVSPDGRLLLYEVKEGGERTGVFELLEIETRKRLPDFLPRGYLRGFAFAPDGKSFYYAHEATGEKGSLPRGAHQHYLGATPAEDREILDAGEDKNLRIAMVSDSKNLFLLVYHRRPRGTVADIYLRPFASEGPLMQIFAAVDYILGVRLVAGRILALIDLDAPNRRIAEIILRADSTPYFVEVLPERDSRIRRWLIVGSRILVSYLAQRKHRLCVFDLSGNQVAEIPTRTDQTLRVLDGSPDRDELLFETESFTEPVSICRYSTITHQSTPWSRPEIPFDSSLYCSSQAWFPAKDGTDIPISLVGRRDVLDSSRSPTIMTAYGGFGVPMSPQFSVLVAYLMERGCLFALPNIRGGSEFGAEWHAAAIRGNRQTAYDDFLCAGEWLLETGRTERGRLAIFGGSNSGLLVGAAMTQRPDLFRAVLSMAPILDMLRYHLFDNARIWQQEFGSADDPEDFPALLKYSPYHQVRDGVSYPATMIVSGDRDECCNGLHARKMTARLQRANGSQSPVVLDYSRFRGHSPVLPLSVRIEALTDRAAFLSDQLELP